MDTEDFKISHKHYATNSLTYILYQDKVIDYVETYSEMYFLEI